MLRSQREIQLRKSIAGKTPVSVIDAEYEKKIREIAKSIGYSGAYEQTFKLAIAAISYCFAGSTYVFENNRLVLTFNRNIYTFVICDSINTI